MPEKFFHYHKLSFLIALISLLFLGAACASQIGDECSRNNECPPGSTCDTTIPDGYCTISNCQPNTCPTEAVCIEFTSRTSYCMLHCQSDDECRQGQVCREDPQTGVGFCYVPG